MEISNIGFQPTRITGDDQVNEGESVSSAQRAGQTPERVAAEQVSRADSVEISERARELAKAQDAVQAAPDVRSEKIQELKARIGAGTYHVPTEEIARKLLGDMSDTAG